MVTIITLVIIPCPPLAPACGSQEGVIMKNFLFNEKKGVAVHFL
jgi:hypothetical protein